MNIAVIFASGRGTRMGTEIPKQFLEINGKPILVHTVELFQYHPLINKVYVVTLEGYIPYVEKLTKIYNLTKICGITKGGDSAQESIYNGLKMVENENPEDSIVLLHDGVRPFVSSDVITRNIEGVKKNGNAITCVPTYETILTSKDGNEINDVPIRSETYVGQAPQSFYLGDIIKAHDAIRNRPQGYENMVDACTIIRTLGNTAYIVEGNRGNIKVTTPEDVYTFKSYLKYKEDEQTFGLGMTNKIGAQYDLIKNNKGK
nr:2-C-methyl-D-erythritol 4-phosphate cytidylyltransferase [Clostridia bacterium]